MSHIPVLSDQQIRARVGEQSFQRGQRYFRDGAIVRPVRQGMTLKASCEGSRAEPYRLKVSFDAAGVVEASCSCPVGEEGYCKHMAALLLTWREQPERFIEREELEKTLEQRSKEELLALIKLMLQKDLDLETLLDLPLPTGQKRSTPVNPETYRRQAAGAFRFGGDDWGAEVGIADELLAITTIGAGFVQQEDFASAVAVYTAVSGETLDHFSHYNDENGELGNVIRTCVDGLEECLIGAPEDESLRQVIIRALFAVFRYQTDSGMDLTDEAGNLLLAYATEKEKRALADWVREALPSRPPRDDMFQRVDTYHRRAYGGFLLKLQAEMVDDETFLRICRETDMTAELVERLLMLGRVGEASKAAEQADDYDLLHLADLFVQRGLSGVAEDLMIVRSRKSKDARLLVWLKQHYKASNDPDAALELAEKLFRTQPSFEGYQEMRQLARELGRWEVIRSTFLRFLQENHLTNLLIQIYLDEGEIDQAIEALHSRPPPSHSYGWSVYYQSDELPLKVARAAEEARPRAALDIYRQHAERLIALKSREYYRLACQSLVRVRDLYHRLGEQDAWASYIADLREKHRALRALKEELAAANL